MHKKFHLPKAASIFAAEACAILEAFHHKQNNNTQSSIFTDSKSVIRATENINSKTEGETILNIQHIFTYLANNNRDIIIAWVPSHQEMKGSEHSSQRSNIALLECHSKTNSLSRPCCNITIVEQNMERLQKKQKTHNITQDFHQTYAYPQHEKKRQSSHDKA